MFLPFSFASFFFFCLFLTVYDTNVKMYCSSMTTFSSWKNLWKRKIFTELFKLGKGKCRVKMFSCMIFIISIN